MNKWWRNSIVKSTVCILSLLCAIYAGVMTANSINYANKVSEENEKLMEDYRSSSCNSIFGVYFECYYDGMEDVDYLLYETYENLLDYHLRYVSEENILAGNMIQDEDVQEMRDKFLAENIEEWDAYQEQYDADMALLNSQYSDDDPEYEKKKTAIEEQYAEKQEQFEDKINKLVEAYKATLIREQISAWNYIKSQYEKQIENYQYIIYMVDGTIYTNIDTHNIQNTNIVDYFSQFTKHDSYTLGYYYPMIGGYSVSDTPNDVSEVHIAMNEEYYNRINSMNESEPILRSLGDDETFHGMLYHIVFGCIGFALGALYLVIMAGRTAQDDELHMCSFDSIYNDVYTVIVLVTWFLGVGLASYLLYAFYEIELQVLQLFYGLIAGLLASLSIAYLTSIAKHIKNHDLLRHTCIVSICVYVLNMGKRLMGDYIHVDGTVKKRIDRVLIVYSILQILLLLVMIIMFTHTDMDIALCIALLFAIINYVVLRLAILNYVNELDTIKNGVMIIANGNLNYQIPKLRNHSLDSVAQSINSVSEGLKYNVEERVASEKTKIELITNVSHDLKTPLTSIISYIDLLSKSTNAEESKHYLEVLELKSNQLKKLVEDLFEITKVQNGQIQVDLQRICIDDLMSQILAEYDESFASKELTIKYNPLPTKTMIYADGNKMYRVISNIIGNIIKYTMANTRVYIDFETVGENLEMTFKNIANYEMDFDVSEMSQRFKRGDESRTTEGNGLGLAIADSFMQVQNGSLDISKDGDLFKAKIIIPLIQE